MNERERQQFETKLRNLRTTLQRELDACRALGEAPKLSEEDLYDGGLIRKELDLLAKLIVDFAKAAFAAAVSVSTSRASFEACKAEIDQIRDRFKHYIPSLGRRLLNIKSNPETQAIKRVSASDAEWALVQLGMIIEEAEFDFVAGDLDGSIRPTNDQLDDWLAACGTQNSKTAWKLTQQQTQIAVPLKKHFDERWRIRTGGRGPGRPGAKDKI